MHRQTIESYDAGAKRWRETRRPESPDAAPIDSNAAAFRARVGPGLVLDLGCGPGAALNSLNPDAVGIDASLAMLELVDRRVVAAPLIAADIEALPLVDGCASGAFGSFSFQHLPRDQFVDALDEVYRVLRAGGLLELWMHAVPGTDGVRQNDDMGIGRWFTYWSADELADVLPRSGFEVLLIDDDQEFARRTLARRP